MVMGLVSVNRDDLHERLRFLQNGERRNNKLLYNYSYSLCGKNIQHTFFSELVSQLKKDKTPNFLKVDNG